MTLEFAKKEAQRRTKVLCTPHYVLRSGANKDEYIVTHIIYADYELIASYPALFSNP